MKKLPKPPPIEFSHTKLHFMQGAVKGILAAQCGDPDAWRLAQILAKLIDESIAGLPSYQAIPVVEVADS